MPARDSAPIGAPCWVDLMTSDTDRSREFYGQLLGWTATEPSPEFGGFFNGRLATAADPTGASFKVVAGG